MQKVDAVALQSAGSSTKQSQAIISLVEVAESSELAANATGTKDTAAESPVAEDASPIVTDPPIPLATSSSIDDVVPPPMTAPIAPQEVQSENHGEIQEVLQERERASSISSLNPSMSRFVLRIPLLGRPKVPLDQIPQAMPGNSDGSRERSSSSTLDNARGQNKMVDVKSGVY